MIHGIMGFRGRVPTGIEDLIGCDMNEGAGGVIVQEVVHSPLNSALAVPVSINGDHGGPFFCII